MGRGGPGLAGAAVDDALAQRLVEQAQLLRADQADLVDLAGSGGHADIQQRLNVQVKYD